MPARRPAAAATSTPKSVRPSRRHARGRTRRRGAAVVVGLLLVLVVGAGVGVAVVGPSNIEVFGWRPVGGDGQTAAASSRQADPAGSAKAMPEPTNATMTAEEPAADPVEPVPDPNQMAADVVAVTNAQRAAAGLPELAVSACATEQVTARVAQLVATDAFEHPPLEPVLTACAVSAAGENLAKGYLDGAAVVDGWMNSENHKANLLGDWTETGVACQLRGDGQWLCGAVYTRV